MYQDALETLEYAKTAVQELKLTNFDDNLWKLRYITTVTLLRSVLHVSDKIDCANIKKGSCAEYTNFWNNKKEEDIFKNFIDTERNNAIKEFKIIENKKIESFKLVTENGNNLVTESGNYLIGSRIMIGDCCLYTKLEEAAQWITDYLSKINKKFLQQEK